MLKLASMISLITAVISGPVLETNTAKASVQEITPQISAGYQHTCALDHLGTVTCWGDNSNGQTAVPLSLGQVRQVSVGASHTCAVTVMNFVRCWGLNQNGETNVPGDLGEVKQISAGGNHTCAITQAGSVRCWGFNGNGQSTPPANLGPQIQVSAGEVHTCSIDVMGKVHCWGLNYTGQVAVPNNLPPVVQITAGALTTCALTKEGAIRCWGANSYNASNPPNNLGYASQVSTRTDTTCAIRSYDSRLRCWGYDTSGIGYERNLGQLGQIALVSAGNSYNCVLTNTGSVKCWGFNCTQGYTHGQCDVPKDLQLTAPNQVTSPKISIAGSPTVGSTLSAEMTNWDIGDTIHYTWLIDGQEIPGETTQSYALKPEDIGKQISVKVSGELYGYISEAELPSEILQPNKIPTSETITSTISAGYQHSCALSAFGKITCWGNDSSGQLDVPADLGPAISVSAGNEYTCAVTLTFQGRCWGSDYAGAADTPNDLGLIRQLIAGEESTCALTLTGKIKCWGNISAPDGDFPAAKQIATYAGHGCARLLDDSVSCWGFNHAGQADAPSNLGPTTGVYVGGNHSCALKNSGLVACWGYSPNGETSVPGDLGTALNLSTGAYNTCATTVTKALRCWGLDYFGQNDVPADLGGVIQLSVGYEHVCAITVLSKVRCWGNNNDYQADVPSNLQLIGEFKNTPTPQISGVPQIGNSLTLATGVWDDTASLHFQWSRDGVDIPGADQSTFTTSLADYDHRIAARVTATANGYNTVIKMTDPVSIDMGLLSTLIRNNPCPNATFDSTGAPPNINGTATVSKILSGGAGLWPEKTKLCRMWVEEGKVVNNLPSGGRYHATAADLGHQLQFFVVGTDLKGASTFRFSEPIAITKQKFVNAKKPIIRGNPTLSSYLSAQPQPWSSKVDYTFQWFRNGKPIDSAQAKTYKPTNADANAELTLEICGHKENYVDLCLLSDPMSIN